MPRPKKSQAKVPVFDGEVNFSQLVKQSVAEADAKLEAFDRLFGIGKAHWELDQDARTLTFDNREGVVVSASVQVIGTLNKRDKTWLWAWDHPSIESPLRKHARKVLRFGKKHGIDELLDRKIRCTPLAAWRLTALVCMLNKAQGAYAGDHGGIKVYMTFDDVAMNAK